jgi:hypothetical protein
LCEQLRIRDLLNDVAVQIDGSLVASYEAGGIQSYYTSDEGRNRLKGLLEALVRSLPERSMRMQVRFEISEGTGDLVSRYIRERRNESQVLRELDRLHIELWRSREAAGFYLQHFLHLYFVWNPRIHHESPDLEWKRKMKSSGNLSLSAAKCIERSRREHDENPILVHRPVSLPRPNAGFHGADLVTFHFDSARANTSSIAASDGGWRMLRAANSSACG